MQDFSFDIHGNIEPYQIIRCTNFEYLERFFVDKFSNSNTRSVIFNGFLRYIYDLREVIGNEWTIWIDGSFTTKKLNPEDIDILNIFDWNETINSQMNFLSENFWSDNSKKKYSVDGYFLPVYSEHDERNIDTIEGRKYWKDWFGNTSEATLGQRRAKGIIEIEVKFNDALIEFINTRI